MRGLARPGRCANRAHHRGPSLLHARSGATPVPRRTGPIGPDLTGIRGRSPQVLSRRGNLPHPADDDRRNRPLRTERARTHTCASRSLNTGSVPSLFTTRRRSYPSDERGGDEATSWRKRSGNSHSRRPRRRDVAPRRGERRAGNTRGNSVQVDGNPARDTQGISTKQGGMTLAQ
jgi:hypothetical protein